MSKPPPVPKHVTTDIEQRGFIDPRKTSTVLSPMLPHPGMTSEHLLTIATTKIEQLQVLLAGLQQENVRLCRMMLAAEVFFGFERWQQFLDGYKE